MINIATKHVMDLEDKKIMNIAEDICFVCPNNRGLYYFPSVNRVICKICIKNIGKRIIDIL